MPHRLPFDIKTHIKARHDSVQFVAVSNGEEFGIGRYVPGDVPRRRQVAAIWAKNEGLQNGRTLTIDEVADALEAAETEARASIEEQSKTDNEPIPQQPDEIDQASYVDDKLIVELAWNYDTGHPDLIAYDRQARSVSRGESVPIPGGSLVPPNCSNGLLTPGSPIPGSILLPSEYDETGVDEDRLRHDVEVFIRSYVELTDAATKLCVEYVLLTWVYDSFDTLPYLAFRTADCGRGKSRALGTVGALSYRGILCGGGSTAAATLRLLDSFGGTLIADEFDQRDSELASELTRILNQGFEQNRPLVRCVGDSNEPKAFRCFSPKLFAIRKGFADDATESRMISVRMRQRTRDDIPISLNRREFDQRALALRNRLLAWRFANLGKIAVDLAHVDPRLEDRCNQIGLPLFAVARTAEGRERIVFALLEQQDTVAGDRADSLPGAVFAVIMAIANPGETIRPGEVATEYNLRQAKVLEVDFDKLPKDERLSSNKAGWLIKNVLELPRCRDRDGTSYKLDPDRLTQLCSRFGIDAGSDGSPAETLPPLPHCNAKNLPQNQNPPLDSAKSDCGNVASVATSGRDPAARGNENDTKAADDALATEQGEPNRPRRAESTNATELPSVSPSPEQPRKKPTIEELLAAAKPWYDKYEARRPLGFRPRSRVKSKVDRSSAMRKETNG